MKTILKAISMIGLCTVLSLTGCNKNAASDTTESSVDTTSAPIPVDTVLTETDTTKVDSVATDTTKKN